MLTIQKSTIPFAYQKLTNRKNVSIGAQAYENNEYPHFLFNYDAGGATITDFILFEIKTADNAIAVTNTDGSPIVVQNITLNENLIVKAGNNYYFNGSTPATTLTGFYYYHIIFSNTVEFRSEIFMFSTPKQTGVEYSPFVLNGGGGGLNYEYADQSANFIQTVADNTFVTDILIIAKTNTCAFKIGTTLGGGEIVNSTIATNGDYSFFTLNDFVTNLYFTITSGTISIVVFYEITEI